MSEKIKSPAEAGQEYIGKFVHYDEGKIGKVLTYDPEQDRFLICPEGSSAAAENFFIKADKLRNLQITEV